MNKQLTISIRGALVTAIVALALVTAYLLGGHGGSAAVAAPTTGPTTASSTSLAGEARTLTMSGVGTATVVPDELSFSLGVVVTRTDLDDALDSANQTLDKVYTALEGVGVQRKDIQTAGLSMTPVYDYHNYAPPTLRGYRVSQRSSVLVRDLKDGGKAVSAAVATGGNDVRVNNLKLKVGDLDSALNQARADAVASATEKAQQYAEATGESLGSVLTLREVPNSGTSTRELGYASAGAATFDSALKALPIRAGRDTTTVRVQVVWEFGG